MATKHNHPVVFGRKVEGCPRCEELGAGAVPVKGWGSEAKAREARQLAAIRHHDCQRSHCGPVCTFGEW